MFNTHKHRTPFLKYCSVLFLVIIVSACQTLDTTQYWPDDIPDRKNFIPSYLEKRNIKTVDPEVLNQHLVWVIRFYHGTTIYPNGWNNASAMLLASIEDPAVKEAVAQDLHQLGIKIVNEWAHENELRNINSTNIATWGSALRTAAQRNDQIGFLEKINNDVDLLIARQLKTEDINYERYYPEQEFDDF